MEVDGEVRQHENCLAVFGGSYPISEITVGRARRELWVKLTVLHQKRPGLRRTVATVRVTPAKLSSRAIMVDLLACARHAGRRLKQLE